MIYYVDEGRKELPDVMLQRVLGEAICKTLRNVDGAKMQVAVHDRAVDVLEEIYHILEREWIEDGDCIEQILAVYYREFGCLTLRHRDHVQRIYDLALGIKDEEKDG